MKAQQATHIEPMLATLGSLALLDDEHWGYEMKWDGVRAIVQVQDGRVTLTSRNDIDMSVAYPELQPLGAALNGLDAVLDGEIVAFDAHGRPSFGRLQKRMHVGKAAEAKSLAASDPAVLLVFDLLRLDGQSLLDRTYSERRAALESLELTGPAWQTPAAFTGAGAEAVRVSQDQQLEGVVAKRLTSTYLPGRRSPDWIKIKNIRTQEVVIGGWRPGAGRRSGVIGSLLLGLPGENGLTYIGKVGTGFTDAALADLGRQLEPLRCETSPFVNILRAEARDAQWVTPQIVGEVAFGEWTSDERLRHPAWRGLRLDKRVDQVVRES